MTDFGILRAEEARAADLDASDPVAAYHDRFIQPEAPAGGPGVYLCGNSLGLLPRASREEVERVLTEWGRLAVRGHHEALIPWIPYNEALTAQAAEVVGALPLETIIMNTLTVNLHLMMVSFYRPHGRRCRIIMEAQAFPSDRYAVTSQIRLHGLDPAECLVEVGPRPGEDCLRTDDIVETIQTQGEQVALVLFSGIHYLTGQWFDMRRIVEAGHAVGAAVGFDLAHAAGNVPLSLHGWNADFAVWCSYKYLNGGPGAPGGCFVHERHARSPNLPRLAGWWGTDRSTRFTMAERFQPEVGAGGWQLSNPPMLAMAAVKASLDLFAEVGMETLRSKSENLTGFLHALLADGERLPYEVVTPPSAGERGCQLSIRVRSDAGEMVGELAARGFVLDARPPDIVRVAPVPFFNTFRDVWEFARAFRELAGVDAG